MTSAAKLMKLCDAAGFDCIDDLLSASITDSVCPAICMTEGCDYTTEMEPDQTEGYCEACGGNTVVSVLSIAPNARVLPRKDASADHAEKRQRTREILTRNRCQLKTNRG